MTTEERRIRSVAIIGAGAAGAVTAAAFKAENYFERIQVFERRDAPGGTWLFDPHPRPAPPVRPGHLAPDIDPPLSIPEDLPRALPPNRQERFEQTPVYGSLTSNVPDIAMSFSDARFAYGPFAPHYVPRQYIEGYFATHRADEILVLSTTVEDVSRLAPRKIGHGERWRLTLRRYDGGRRVDEWWKEEFDAVIFANGHYSVPYVPHVDGLEAFIGKYPGRVIHSKLYRSPLPYADKKVLIVGNSASGHDLTAEIVSAARLPVYQSRRSASRWDGDQPPPGIEWKPVIKEFRPNEGGGRVLFEDGTSLDDVDTIIYCTGYQSSYPFWNAEANGRPFYDYKSNKLINVYWHTFIQDFPTLGVVGQPRALTFRSFEYQAVALARLFSDRNARPLPPLEEQQRWERERLLESRSKHVRFHDIPWESGGTLEWLDGLFQIAGLGTLRGDGRIPPVLGDDLIWAIENIKKYPEPVKTRGKDSWAKDDDGGWVVVEKSQKGCLSFI